MSWKEKFPIGSRWQMENGEEVSIETHSENSAFPITDSIGYYRTASGEAAGASNKGLVKRLDVPAAPDWREKFPVGSAWRASKISNTRWVITGHDGSDPARPLKVQAELSDGFSSGATYHYADGSFYGPKSGLGPSQYDLVERLTDSVFVGEPTPRVQDEIVTRTYPMGDIVSAGGCSCGKDKFGFWFHASYCPLYISPQAMLAAQAAPLPIITSRSFMTPGDLKAEAALLKKRP